MQTHARVRDLLDAFEGAFERRGWHGPSVLQALRGLSSEQAKKRPAGAHHSIHELVEHIAYWEERGIRYLAPRGSRARSARDWARPEHSFAASVARLKAIHARLIAAIEALGDSDLDRRISTGSGPMPLGRALHGVAAHAAYHAGQIGLLKSLLQSHFGL
jgi:uncharacterized damage-inducible protein DinB